LSPTIPHSFPPLHIPTHDLLPIQIAAKTVDKHFASPAAIDDQIAETERHAKVKHPHVVACFGWTESLDAKQYYMLQELMEGDVISLIRKWRTDGVDVTAGARLRLLLGPALGLHHLHTECGIIHRDIAARNTCYTQKEEDGTLVAKLMDLGLSRDMDAAGEYGLTLLENGNMRVAIPIDRTAPECLVAQKDADGNRRIVATRENDVFAMAVYFWEVLTGGLVPYDPQVGARYEAAVIRDIPKHVTDGNRLEIPDVGPLVGLDTLITSMWHQDPTQRPTMEQVSGRGVLLCVLGEVGAWCEWRLLSLGSYYLVLFAANMYGYPLSLSSSSGRPPAPRHGADAVGPGQGAGVARRSRHSCRQ
jgi:serine/threonine protein kinase